MFTVSDIIHLIQYYYKSSTYEGAAADVETLRLESLRGKPIWHTRPFNMAYYYADIEKDLGVEPPPLLREHPSATLFDTAKLLIQTHARRVPLLDNDTETGHEVIVSVLTQYRLLKFISINVCGFVQLLYCATNPPYPSVLETLRSYICHYENSRSVHMCRIGHHPRREVPTEILSIPSLRQACPHLCLT